MMDVQKQLNGSDCGIFAIAYCYELCSGLDPCKAKLDCKMVREHLSLCLQNHCMSWFPVLGERRAASKVKSTQEVDLHCSCHMPEGKGEQFAECDGCNKWFHQHCQDIPNEVFNDTQDVHWLCSDCFASGVSN